MKLFQNDQSTILNLSIEQFNSYYSTASIVSTEAVSDFLYKLKDSFSTIKNSLTESQDKVVTDTLTEKFELEHVIKRLKFNEIKDELVQKPENFKGKYVNYIEDLSSVSSNIVTNTESTINNLKLAISSFMNEYKEDEVHALYGVVYFKEADKMTERDKKEISKYFPNKDNSTKAHVEDVLKTLNDIPVIHSSISTLESVINQEKIKNISKLAGEATELVDLLIEQNNSSGILLKTEHIKKELVNALHITAKEVELVGYLYGNAIFFYSAFKNLSEVLIAKANQK